MSLLRPHRHAPIHSCTFLVVSPSLATAFTAAVCTIRPTALSYPAIPSYSLLSAHREHNNDLNTLARFWDPGVRSNKGEKGRGYSVVQVLEKGR